MKIILNSKEGFFASLTWALYCWRHADETGQHIRVEINGPYGQNYLSKYMFQSVEGDGGKTLTVHEYKELGWPNYMFNRKIARDVFSRHATIKVSVLNEADMFTVNGFLGAHYRGTDKSYEAKPISFDEFSRLVCGFRKENNFNGLYFATDVRGLELPGDDVIQRKDEFRSGSGEPVHKSCSNRVSDIGMDAMVNCIVLSRCKVLMRTRSRLSAWAGILNPNLDMITLNKMHGKPEFPEGD